eukprot:TRINITY_DN9119_c1_g2_i2.p1 TRINITY_DN9119_c1_g2~~TRINITY_DN9119_c1_g2_i2.p1  ORF type:complete len:120 (+),score=1.95 TRINITY_DN9119_c1_g2_i2:400-759(+)
MQLLCNFGYLYAIDANTSNIIWRNQLEGMSLSNCQSLLSFGNMILVGMNGNIAAVDKQSGDTVWVTKLPNKIYFVSLGTVKNRYFASCWGYLYKFDTESGSILYNNNLKGMGYHTVSFR